MSPPLAAAHAEADERAPRPGLIVHPDAQRHAPRRAGQETADPAGHGPPGGWRRPPVLAALAGDEGDDTASLVQLDVRFAIRAEDEPDVAPGAVGQLERHPVAALDDHEELVAT